MHVFDRWCWLGTVKTLDAAAELARSAPRVFEADAARLALQSLSGRLSAGWVELTPERPDLAAPNDGLQDRGTFSVDVLVPSRADVA